MTEAEYLTSHELSKPFSYIYNQSILQGIVHNVLKVSRKTPIFKSGDASDPAYYRPIAVLSPFDKVLEKIVNDQLISFIDKYNHHIQNKAVKNISIDEKVIVRLTFKL